MSERESYQVQENGPRKYKEHISKDSKRSDNNMNLPYKFSKPRKEKNSNIPFVCIKCAKVLFVNEDAVLVECGSCSQLNRVRETKRKEQE
jgi:hypothetical protein